MLLSDVDINSSISYRLSIESGCRASGKACLSGEVLAHFPASRRYFDKEAGMERRHHIHEAVVQKPVKIGAEEAGITKHAKWRQEIQRCYDRTVREGSMMLF